MAYDGFYLTYKADRETNERFDRVRKRFPNIRMVKINLEDWSDPKLDQAITKIAEIANTKHFWVIDPDVKVDDDFDFEFRTSEYDNDVVHLWNAEERNVFRAIVGVKLFKTSEVKSKEVAYIQDAYFMTGEFKEHETKQVEYKPTTETYEIFYWKKDYGDENFNNLKERFPEINTVTGNTNLDVHEFCRSATRTDFYYLIHPNTVIADTFNFDYSFAFGLDKEKQKVVIWQKENPKTNLVREYHGIGLFPKDGLMFKEREYDIFNFRRKAVYEQDTIASDLEFPVIRTDDLHNLNHNVDSDMYWLVHNDVIDPVLEHYPFSYDREFIHNFKVTTSCGKAIRNGVRLVPNNPDTDKQKDVDQVVGNLTPTQHISASTLKGGLAKIEKYPSLIVDPAVTLTNDFDFYPDLYELASVHMFEKGVVFVASEYDEFNIKIQETVAATIPEYDIFFWDRGFGKNNLAELKERHPRIQNVSTDTLIELHELAQKNSTHNYYYVITSDTTVTDFNFDYEFDFSMTEDGRQQIVVWQKSDWEDNALEYHGVGLFRKDYELFEERKYQRFDFRRKALYQHTTNIKPVRYDVIYTDDVKHLSQVKKCDTEMVWLVDKNVHDAVTNYVPLSYDKTYIHNFHVEISNGAAIRNGVRLVPYNYDEEQQKDVEKVLGSIPSFNIIYSSALKSGLEQIKEYPVCIVDPALKLKDDFSFYPDLYDEASVYIFNPGGVVFVAKEYDEFNVKFIEEDAAIHPDYDIFFWHRGYGTQNFNELQSRFPRIQSVSTDTISELHEFARTNSKQNYYYVITSDTTVTDFDFNYQFDFSMTEEGRQQIVVWQKTDWNDVPIEYHGVGLFRKDYDEFTDRKYQQFDFRRKALYQETAAVKPERYDVCHVNDLLALDTIKNCDTEMVWMIHSDVSDAITDYIPPLYDRSYIHNFNVELPSGKTVRNGVRLVPINYDTEKQKDVDAIAGTLRSPERIEARTVKEAVALATQETFWMVNPDLQLTDTMIDDFYPDLYDTGPTHIWKFTSRKGVELGHGGLALSNKNYHPENVIYHDEFVARIPDRHNIKKYYTRDPYKAYKQSTKQVFYWVVDTVVELVDDFDFDYYPDIHSIENVFAFKSEGEADAGVYLVHRPHLAEFNPSEEDFSFDRFKNIIRVDHVASRTVGHPVFYFDEGMYKDNTAKFDAHSNIDVIDATDLAAAYKKAAKMSSTGYFWAIDNDVELLEDFDRTFYIDRHHKSHFHVWPKESPYTGFVHQYGGLKLIPTAAILELKPDADKLRKMTFKNKKPVRAKTPMTRDIPYDVIMLSYQEKLADEHYAKLLERVPHAKRVHGVKGIFNAHQAAANLADTRMFYVIDADALLLEEFNFEYSPSIWDEDTVHTWKSKNPVNDLIYGYGGLKLFPTQLLRDATDWRIDFTTSVSEKFKPMPTPANYTAFNTDPFNTWKSAFRECTKLASSIIHNSKQDEDDERLEAWCTKGADRDFGKYAIAGANAGRAWGTKHADNDEMLGMINDFAWLEEKFEENNND
jgi:hypothetical protein